MTTQLTWTFDPENPVYQQIIAEPERPDILEGTYTRAFLWARTVLCPHCAGLIPLSPSWELSPTQGIQLMPNFPLKLVGFRVVSKKEGLSRGTVKQGIATCPLCGGTTAKGYLRDEQNGINSQGSGDSVLTHHPHNTAPGDPKNRMGNVCYCRISRYHYPIYRQRKPPLQGKGPIEYWVPDSHLYASDLERWRCLELKGLVEAELPHYPLLQGGGLWGEDDTDTWAGLRAQLGGEAALQEFLADDSPVAVDLEPYDVRHAAWGL